jgi:hypothetical protein
VIFYQDKCQLCDKLHVALLFTCLFLWVYPMCGYNYLYIYGYFLYMLHVYVYCYFSMNLCIHIMYLFVYVLYIKFCKSSVCICFNCMQFEKFMWHSLVGCWVCYSMFHRENERVLWSSMAWPGWLGMLQENRKIDRAFHMPPLGAMESIVGISQVKL